MNRPLRFAIFCAILWPNSLLAQSSFFTGFREWLVAVIAIVLLGIMLVWIRKLQRQIKIERILNYFATSLYGQNTIDDIFWDVAKNCISQLKFEDCVIYYSDTEHNLLIQKAAYGPKNPEKHEIINPIQIPFGKGIVGAAAASETTIIVADTSKDDRYIVDDRHRHSEIAVPILLDGKLFGVIDSEHSSKNFYTPFHAQLLEKIADICSNKISRHLVAEKVRTDIARDLHDEMGSTLTSINILSKLALQQSGTPDMHANLQKIKDYSGNIMESMGDIVWAINPLNDSIDRMILRMRELAEELLEPAGINYHFQLEEEVKALILDVNQRKELYLVYKEALNNAVKYSQASEIVISLKQHSHELKLQLHDNGIGFDSCKSYSGNGINNMHSRAKKIAADLQIHSSKGSGTDICMTLKID
jgi:signal transduction histidine kinase